MDGHYFGLKRLLISSGLFAIGISMFLGWFNHLAFVLLLIWIFRKWLQNRELKMQLTAAINVAEVQEEENKKLCENLDRKRVQMINSAKNMTRPAPQRILQSDNASQMF